MVLIKIVLETMFFGTVGCQYIRKKTLDYLSNMNLSCLDPSLKGLHY